MGFSLFIALAASVIEFLGFVSVQLRWGLGFGKFFNRETQTPMVAHTKKVTKNILIN